jgi:uncharacterized protein YdaU (DUF1376 family)
LPIIWRVLLILSTTEHGAYLLLIMHYWSKGGPPESDEIAMRVTRLSARQWEKSAPILKSLFEPGWQHKRIDAELAQVAAKSRSASANARKSHEARRRTGVDSHPTVTDQNQTHIQIEDDDLRSDQAGVEKLVSAFLEAVGISEAPSNWSELPTRAAKWIEAGYPRRMIVTEARRVASGSPAPKPLLYFEKVFATAFARAEQPLPTIAMNHPEKAYVKRTKASAHEISNELDREITRARRAQENDGTGSIGAGQGIAGLLPPR